MKHRLTVLALMVIAAAGCKNDHKPAPADKPMTPAPPAPPDAAAKEAPTWKQYTSTAGKFSIDLPGTPKESTAGAVAIVGAEFGTTTADSRTALCGVAYTAASDASADPKIVLDGATARIKQGATVIEEKDVTIGKHPGRSVIVENSSHRKWVRAYLVDKTIYILNCGGPFDRAATDGPIVSKVLDSFKLTN